MTILDPALTDTMDAYRTCEFVTLGRDGTPLTWPTAARRRKDGTLLVTTSLAFAQKALNVRRDGRVALLFSDPTGSGLTDAPQLFVTGTAVCPDDIVTGPEGAEDYWTTLFERQPDSRKYVVPPGRWLMGWYYLRLHITVTPTRVTTRPPLAPFAATAPVPAGPRPLGAGLLARFPSAVLGARDASGAPVLVRTRTEPTEDGFAVEPDPDHEMVPGPASLLVHRHDDRLTNLHNALVRGELRTDGARWWVVPEKVIEPTGAGRAADMFRTLRNARRATDSYLERRGLARPVVRWDGFRALAHEAAARPVNG
ncbi:pyridoxamine 5'-phosphate oxidase family protein [Streptomyces sp. SID12488]|uniref:pyridoxamine 5'-phosphate oxidase family protein n=1 Tax=Streptomyces sp. SID12488 TaxID=2706040 RepID=UPI0013DA7110|nr:pyridoxamine 5'-phosphate oxidase family protein [Streptomyces sp. SID12488]NEA68781.1 pyridoxamine 5'-phosphate oxidase [Streptomyces sp. SID12488]